jgi:ribosomal protein S12 methylthiotransferase accessory factor
MTIKITRIKGFKQKADVDGFEIISGRVDDNTAPEGPSPGRIMVASLGLCVGLYAAHYLKRHNISDEGLTVDIEAIDAGNPARAESFDIVVNLKAKLTEEEKAGIIASVSRCYVGNTLKMAPEVSYRLNLSEP